MSVLVRTPQSTSDWQAVRDICCRTGQGGDPIDPKRWPFFAEQWVGPYQRLLPEWTFVAERDGRIAGYLTGCPRSTEFNRVKFWRFDLPLSLKVLFGARGGRSSDERRFLRRFLRLEKTPEDCFSPELHRILRERYPAHLHINLDSEFRGCGLGRALMDSYLERLQVERVVGVHLFCGAGPLEFYRRLGFEELASIEFKTGVFVYALGRVV